MKIILTIVILGTFILFCINGCTTYKEERFKNKLVEDFKTKGFNINNPKYNTLKVNKLLIVTYIDNYDDYLINIGFYTTLEKEKVFVSKVLLGNKEISINKEVILNYKVNNNLYSGKLVYPNSEEILSMKKKDIFKLIKVNKLTITIYFKLDNKEEQISIDLEQYTARGIVWPT